MSYKKITGIYKILNNFNNKSYIGSAVSIYNRFSKHKQLLRSNLHFNKHLQSAWNKYTEQLFSFIILEQCEEKLLSLREEFWIKQLKTSNNKFGYNRRIDCRTNLGIKASIETKEKLRISHLGIKHPEWRNKLKAISKYKKVYQYNINGDFIAEFNSILEAEEKTNIYKQAISACCRKKLIQTKGFQWSFDKVDKLIPRKKKSRWKTQKE